MKPYYEADGIVIYNADCLEILPSFTVDWVVTDPPYGIRKAAWDDAFPIDWLPIAANVALSGMAIMPGVNNIARLPQQIGLHEYRWCLAVHLTNGMTRGMLGFGNWIPCLVYTRQGISLYQAGQDCTDIAIVGGMPDHPSPKPYQAMRWLLSRLPHGSVLDPFMGSGTTLVAAKQLGRKAIGIEISRDYCDIAVERLRQAVLPLEFDAPEPQPDQLPLGAL